MSYTVRAQAIPDSMLHWRYTTKTDEMSGEKTYMATVFSPDTIPMDLGGNNVACFLFEFKGKTISPIMRFAHGNISSSAPGAQIKFDDEPAEYYLGDVTSDNFDVIYFTWGKRILKKMLTAHKVMIRVDFYKEGLKILHFNVDGLKPPGA